MFDTGFEMRGRPEGLIFHSDQGLQYTSFVFRRHLRELKIKQSFSNPGTRLDNAVAESFFTCVKREELLHNYYDTVEELQRDVDDYVELFNNMRPYQRLGMSTPSEVELDSAEKNKRVFLDFPTESAQKNLTLSFIAFYRKKQSFFKEVS